MAPHGANEVQKMKQTIIRQRGWHLGLPAAYGFLPFHTDPMADLPLGEEPVTLFLLIHIRITCRSNHVLAII